MAVSKGSNATAPARHTLQQGTRPRASAKGQPATRYRRGPSRWKTPKAAKRRKARKTGGRQRPVSAARRHVGRGPARGWWSWQNGPARHGRRGANPSQLSQDRVPVLQAASAVVSARAASEGWPKGISRQGASGSARRLHNMSARNRQSARERRPWSSASKLGTTSQTRQRPLDDRVGRCPMRRWLDQCDGTQQTRDNAAGCEVALCPSCPFSLKRSRSPPNGLPFCCGGPASRGSRWEGYQETGRRSAATHDDAAGWIDVSSPPSVAMACSEAALERGIISALAGQRRSEALAAVQKTRDHQFSKCSGPRPLRAPVKPSRRPRRPEAPPAEMSGARRCGAPAKGQTSAPSFISSEG